MHIQIVNFRLEGVSEADYVALCDDLAGAYAEVPGLERKVWLTNPEEGVYGGVYFWRDRRAMKAYEKSDLFAAVSNHPNLTDFKISDFAVLDGPTRITRGELDWTTPTSSPVGVG